jgi:hypothetical protein
MFRDDTMHQADGSTSRLASDEVSGKKKWNGCRYREGTTHKTNRSKQSQYFKWPDEDLQEEMVRKNISKATGYENLFVDAAAK